MAKIHYSNYRNTTKWHIIVNKKIGTHLVKKWISWLQSFQRLQKIFKIKYWWKIQTRTIAHKSRNVKTVRFDLMLTFLLLLFSLCLLKVWFCFKCDTEVKVHWELYFLQVKVNVLFAKRLQFQHHDLWRHVSLKWGRARRRNIRQHCRLQRMIRSAALRQHQPDKANSPSKFIKYTPGLFFM